MARSAIEPASQKAEKLLAEMPPKTQGLEEARATYGRSTNLPPFVERISDPDLQSGIRRTVWLPSGSGQWPTPTSATSHIVCQRWQGSEYMYWTLTYQSEKYIVKSAKTPDHQGWVPWHKWDSSQKRLSDTRVCFTKEDEPQAQSIESLFLNTGRSSRRANQGTQTGQRLKHADSYQDLRRFAAILEGAEKVMKASPKLVDKRPSSPPRDVNENRLLVSTPKPSDQTHTKPRSHRKPAAKSRPTVPQSHLHHDPNSLFISSRSPSSEEPYIRRSRRRVNKRASRKKPRDDTAFPIVHTVDSSSEASFIDTASQGAVPIDTSQRTAHVQTTGSEEQSLITEAPSVSESGPEQAVERKRSTTQVQTTGNEEHSLVIKAPSVRSKRSKQATKRKRSTTLQVDRDLVEPSAEEMALLREAELIEAELDELREKRLRRRRQDVARKLEEIRARRAR
ncbi:MAG: hypothetical protein Q9191_000932 [Dirinaria sp. TL-2023a]